MLLEMLLKVLITFAGFASFGMLFILVGSVGVWLDEHKS